MFLTLPTILSTRQIFKASSGHDFSNANNSCSLAGSSPNHFGQSFSARITGHTVVQLAQRSVRAACQNRATQNFFAACRRFPFRTETRHHHLRIVDHGDCRFGVKLFPLVETISDNQAPLAARPRIPKGRFSDEFFCAGVDRLSPSGESAPTSSSSVRARH